MPNKASHRGSQPYNKGLIVLSLQSCCVCAAVCTTVQMEFVKWYYKSCHRRRCKISNISEGKTIRDTLSLSINDYFHWQSEPLGGFHTIWRDAPRHPLTSHQAFYLPLHPPGQRLRFTILMTHNISAVIDWWNRLMSYNRPRRDRGFSLWGSFMTALSFVLSDIPKSITAIGCRLRCMEKPRHQTAPWFCTPFDGGEDVWVGGVMYS